MSAKRMTLWNLEVSGSRSTALAAAGVGIVAGGSLTLLLAKSAGVSPGLAALGGAILGGVGAFAAVAHPRFVDDASEEDEAEEVADGDPGDWEAIRIVSYLQEHLGQDVTAYLSGLEPEQAETVSRWASGEAEPERVELGRLRSAYEATHYVLDFYDGETAQAWFFGSWIGGQAPARTLRYSADPAAWKQVVDAAQEFRGLTR